GVGAVINYDLPEEPENYVHRVGRTGRGEEKGMAIAFCADKEKELLEAIEKYTGNPIPIFEVSKNDYQNILEDSDDETDNWRALLEEDSKNNKRQNEW